MSNIAVGRPTEKDRNRAIVEGIAMGRSIEATAQRAGVSTQVVENRIKRLGFLEEVRKERTRMASETGAWLLTWSKHAAQYLMTVMSDPNETTQNRTRASALLLSEGRAWQEASVIARLDELEANVGVNHAVDGY